MSPNRFDYLLELMKAMIMKKNVVRALIPPGERNSLMMHEFHHLCDSLTQWTQTSLRRLQDVLNRSRCLKTKQDVVTTSEKRRRIYDVLKTSDLRRLEDVRFTTSWRRLIYDIFRTSGFRRPEEDVRFILC